MIWGKVMRCMGTSHKIHAKFQRFFSNFKQFSQSISKIFANKGAYAAFTPGSALDAGMVASTRWNIGYGSFLCGEEKINTRIVL
jgi:hypothetical protein